MKKLPCAPRSLVAGQAVGRPHAWRTRAALVIAASFLAAGCVGLMLGARSNQRDAHAASPNAQARIATINLGTPWMLAAAPAGSRVSVRLRRAGREIAFAEATANAGGEARLRLAGFGGAVSAVSMEAGDMLVLTTDGGAVREIVLPTLASTIDGVRGIVAGAAPPDAEVTVHLGSGGPSHPARATAAGRFTATVGPAAAGASGTVRFVESDLAFEAPFSALTATITLGSRRVEGSASPGDRIDALVARTTWRSEEGTRVPTVRLTPGGGITVAGTGPLSNPGGFAMLLRDTVLPGDEITITRSSAWLTPLPLPVRVPTLTLAFEARDRIGGTAPMGASLDLLLVGPDGTELEATTVADASGRWEHELSASGLGPGWWASATISLHPAIRLRAVGAIPRVRVHLHAPVVEGVGRPGHTALVSVRGADGVLHGPWQAPVDDDGRFAAALQGLADGLETVTLPGADDLVLVDFVDPNGRGGDPVILSLPSLSAVADPANGTLSGVAPPAAELVVSVPTEDGSTSTRSVTASAAGDWQLSLAGFRELLPRDGGHLTFTRTDGHEVRLAWAVVGLEAELGGSVITGNAPPHRRVALTLRAEDGVAVASALSVAGADGSWRAVWVDRLGDPVTVRANDLVLADIGDELGIELRVPLLDGVIHVAEDLVAGEAPPDSALLLRVAGAAADGGTAIERPLIVDASGTFAFELSGERDVLYNDRVSLHLAVDRHAVVRTIVAPGLRLDLGSLRLTGSLEPQIEATVLVVRGSDTFARTPVQAEDDATFVTDLRAAVGSPSALEPGDRIIVRAPDARAAQEIVLTVPTFTLRVLPSLAIAGAAPPRGRLRIYAEAVYAEMVVAAAGQAPAIDPRGEWVLAPGRLPVAPGTRLAASLGLPSGHRVLRTHVVPIVSVEVGGSRVCGHAARGTVIDVRRAPGSAGAQGRTDVSYGTFSFGLLAALDDAAAVTVGGDRVSVHGGGLDAAIAVPDLDAQIDWATGEVIVDGPPAREIALLSSAGDCRGEGAWESGDRPPAVVSRHALASDGRAWIRVGAERLASALEGDGMTIVLADPVGHRVFMPLRPVRASLFVGEALITGSAPLGSRVSARIEDDAGTVLADVVGEADALGRFALQPRDTAGDLVTLQPGRIVDLRFGRAGAQHVRLAVEPLAFDWDAEQGVQGEADLERSIALTLALADGSTRRVTTLADELGSWSWRNADIPARAGWTMADVRAVRATVLLPGGHRWVAQTADFDAWVVDPERPPGGQSVARIFLPQTVAGAIGGNEAGWGMALPAVYE